MRTIVYTEPVAAKNSTVLGYYGKTRDELWTHLDWTRPAYPDRSFDPLYEYLHVVAWNPADPKGPDYKLIYRVRPMREAGMKHKRRKIVSVRAGFDGKAWHWLIETEWKPETKGENQ